MKMMFLVASPFCIIDSVASVPLESFERVQNNTTDDSSADYLPKTSPALTPVGFYHQNKINTLSSRIKFKLISDAVRGGSTRKALSVL